MTRVTGLVVSDLTVSAVVYTNWYRNDKIELLQFYKFRKSFMINHRHFLVNKIQGYNLQLELTCTIKF